MISLIALMLLNVSVMAQNTQPKREFRGAWIQAINGQFKGKSAADMQQMLTQQLNALQAAGINAIIFQVRPEADALYASSIEPWSRYLSGVQGQAPNPYWDPMAWMIEECHKRNMEFHAWINPYRAKTSASAQTDPKHITNQHPEWFIPYNNQLFFNPALPESREYIRRVITDIITRYDVDALHMDDYFYPYPANGQDFPDEADFQRLGAGFNNKGDWRRHNVNLLIEEIHNLVRELKPWVKFGISPFGIYRNQKSDPLGSETNGLQNYDDLYADILLWVNKGWIDYNIPQIYWHVGHPAADYGKLVDWWAKNAGNRPLYIGQSILNTVQNADPQHPNQHQLPLKMRLQRQYQTIEGSCQWYTQNIVDNVGNYTELLKQVYHKYPALPPTSPFIDNKAPGKVKKLSFIVTDDGLVLMWLAPKAKTEMDKAVQYVIYRFAKGERVDLSDPSHIVAITRDTYYNLHFSVEPGQYTYVVTALDRLHNESKLAKKKLKL